NVAQATPGIPTRYPWRRWVCLGHLGRSSRTERGQSASLDENTSGAGASYAREGNQRKNCRRRFESSAGRQDPDFRRQNQRPRPRSANNFRLVVSVEYKKARSGESQPGTQRYSYCRISLESAFFLYFLAA